MKTVTRFLLLPLICGFYVACSSDTGPVHNVTAIVTDAHGQPLPLYGLQLIDVNEGWTGIAYKSVQGGEDKPASLFLQSEEPVVLRFVAPGHHPKFTFLMPGFDNIDFEVSLKSSAEPDDPSPVTVGNFNNFNFRSGAKMEQGPDGIWKASIETDLDTVRYFVRYNSLVSAPGTNGRIVFNDDARGFTEAFLSEIVRKENESTVEFEFDTSQYHFGAKESELKIVSRDPSDVNFDAKESDFKITSQNPSDINGIARVYTMMIDEYLDEIFSTVSHHLRGDEGRYEHDYGSFLTKLKDLEGSYNHPDVSVAAEMARFRLYRETGRSKDDAISLLDRIEADSPLWMIHFTALSDAVNLAGLSDYTDLLESIAEKSTFESLRGEALFNLVRHYHDQEDEEKWHATFFELVSNYPEHFRTGYAYESYAPEQPIAEGKALPSNEFNTLDGSGTLNLHELDESYLLIDFWATWCGPCIAEMPKLHDLHEQYEGSDFAIVSISVDEDPERVHAFRNEWGMPWLHGHEQFRSSKIREMGIVGIPHYILLGPDRTVVSNDQSKLRGEGFPKFLDSYLNNN